MQEKMRITRVICHLTGTEVASHKKGYGYGVLTGEATGLLFTMQDNPNVAKKSGKIEINDIASVKYTTLDLTTIKVVIVNRHLHPSIYFRDDSLFPKFPLFNNEPLKNIYDLCSSYITKYEENEYCKIEQLKIDKIKKGCEELGKMSEFTQTQREKFDSIYLCHVILTKIQPEDDIKLFLLLTENNFDITNPIPGWVNKTTFSTSLINYAVKKNLVSIVEYLLEKNIDVGIKFMGQAPIHIACKAKNTKMCGLLYKYHADINSTNDTGETPLSISINMNDSETVKFLLLNNASITEENLQQAVESNNIEIVKHIVEKLKSSNIENLNDMLSNAVKFSNNKEISEYLFNNGAISSPQTCVFQ